MVRRICGLQSVLVFCVALAAVPAVVRGQQDVADVPSKDLRAGGDAKKRYFLIGAMKGVKPPKSGYRLLVVLPGGDGGPNFHPFVKRIYKHALPRGYLVAQLVAVKRTGRQKITWPTRASRVEGGKFPTEDFVDAVLKDVKAAHKLDQRYVFTLSWSSGGPAAYAISLAKKKAITGSLIAMSVFKPDQLPPLTRAKGHAYYLYHSPQDQVCPFRMARSAVTQLKKNGAKVSLATYRGGHGWRAGLYPAIRRGIRWLEANRAQPTTAPATRPAAKSGEAGPEIRPGVGMGPVSFGMSGGQVIKLLGEPDKVEGKGIGLNYLSRGFTLMVHPRSGVVQITCTAREAYGPLAPRDMTDFAGATPEGIAMGAGEEQIVGAYGQPTSRRDYGARTVLEYDKSGVSFVLLGGRLVQLTLTPPSEGKPPTVPPRD